MPLFDLITLFYILVGLRAVYTGWRNWRALTDGSLDASDRRLLDQLAFFVLIPPGVFLHELGHALATIQLGGTINWFGGGFHFGFFYGYVIPIGQFTPLGEWWIALSGNLVSIAYGLIAIPLIPLVHANWQKYFLYAFTRVQLLNALIFYPLITLAGFEGDWRTIYDLRIQFDGIPVGLMFGIFHALLILGLWLVNNSVRVKRFQVSLYAGVAQQLSAFDSKIAVGAHNPEAFIERGNAFTKLGISTLAQADYKQALTLDPNNARALYNLGQLELARKNLSGAEKYFRAALERTLGEAELYARLHYGLGLILNERGAREQAVKEFDQALGRDDQFAPAYFWRGMARRSLGQGERARADFEKAAELSTATNPALADQARAMVRET